MHFYSYRHTLTTDSRAAVCVYLVPQGVQHVEQLEGVDQDHGSRRPLQTLKPQFSQGHGHVDHHLDTHTHSVRPGPGEELGCLIFSLQSESRSTLTLPAAGP